MANPFPSPVWTVLDSNGDPVAGALLYFYAAGTSTDQSAYTDSALTAARAQGAAVDAGGQAVVYLDPALSYKVNATTSAGAQLDNYPVDNINGADLVTTVKTVATVAALTALMSQDATILYQTLGYYAAGDGGHGTYRWNASDTSTANGGTVLQPDALPATGRFNLVYSGALNVRQFGAKGDGATDDTAAIQAAIDAMNAAGGGGVLIPSTDDFYNITLPIVMKSGVTLFGQGAESYIKNTNSNTGTEEQILFILGNQHPYHYNFYTLYTLDTIAAGDSIVTTSTPSEAGNFSVGQVVNITSLESRTAEQPFGTNIWPFHFTLNRVMAVDPGTGDITLAYPIDENITNPQINDLTGYTQQIGALSVPSYVLDRAVVRDLSIECEMEWMGRTCCYECVIDNIWVRKARKIIDGNAYAHCSVSRIRGNFTFRFVEVDQGSHDTVFEDFQGGFLENGETITSHSIMQISGESRNIRFSNWVCHAGAWTGATANGLQVQTRKSVIENGKIYGGTFIDASRITTADWTYADADIRSDNVLRNIEFRVSECDSLFNLTGTASHAAQPDRNTIKDCKFFAGTLNLSAFRGVTGSYGIYDGNYFDGPIMIANDAFVYHTFHHNHYTNLSTTTRARLYNQEFKYNTRIGSEGFRSARVRALPANVSSTTPNNVVETTTVPASQNIGIYDRIWFRIEGIVTPASTNDAKTISITDSDGAFVTMSFGASDVGPYKISGYLTIRATNLLRGVFVIDSDALGVDCVRASRVPSDYFADGTTYEVQAWVANASDVIEIDSMEIIPQLLGDDAY